MLVLLLITTMLSVMPMRGAGCGETWRMKDHTMYVDLQWGEGEQQGGRFRYDNLNMRVIVKVVFDQ